MNISQQGIDLIKSFEGCRLTAYDDGVGVQTIGYGHVQGVVAGMTITQDQADEYLRQDIEKFEKCVNNAIVGAITQGQFDALCSFAFNLGCAALGKSTLLRHVNEGNDDLASAEFLRWNKAAGKVMAGLTRRRQAEMEMFLA